MKIERSLTMCEGRMVSSTKYGGVTGVACVVGGGFGLGAGLALRREDGTVCCNLSTDLEGVVEDRFIFEGSRVIKEI